jgi:hypothetical protein
MNHTKGPWRYHKDENGRGYEFYGQTKDKRFGFEQSYKEICRINSRKTGARRGMSPTFYSHPEDQANAAFIVRACNSHDELLEALKTAQVRIFMLEGASDEYNKADAAIDKAEGRK